MDIKDILGREFLVFDGAMGSLLQKRGLGASELPETWNVAHKEEIISIHLEYLSNGANIIKTNTFGANRIKYLGFGEVERIISAGVSNAAEAIRRSNSDKPHFVALDIGPTGKLLKPFGDLEFEEAVSIFGEMVRAGKDGADLILIETMSDLYETKAAVIAAKENSNLPVFVTNAYEKSGKLMTGATPEAVCATLEGLGVDAIGLNCSFGPKQMIPVVEKLADVCSVPVIVNPNAGLPDYSDGNTTYSIDENQFAEYMKEIIALGVHVVGGCCGTTPAYIAALCGMLEGEKFFMPFEKNISVVSSYNHAVAFGSKPVVIGEQINPDMQDSYREALKNNDIDCIIDMGLDQEDAGADIIAVSIGLPENSGKELMTCAITELQSVTGLPLRIDTCNYDILEAALRIYNGKAMIGFEYCNGEYAASVFPIVKKYGGTLMISICDTETNSSDYMTRQEIVGRVYECAAQYGISKKDIIIDISGSAVSAGSIPDMPDMDAMSAVISSGELEKNGLAFISQNMHPDTLCVLHFADI